MSKEETELCEAGDWTNITGQEGQCPNKATHVEHWFDEEAVPVSLCDEHATD
jgi:hypothetical protein